ncbi:DUF6520 family protein [Sinomicrobium weinanense]|uniref:Uncharacterized protein n=1 Tax=Sinomicrobium weinanense TaxID=2842200 RepID=A0A926Q1T7_9FLAO|nr:DUF6520 family protein [Sinomicrobium weinanense]MBC9795129.1 hypothetical protein [Sinomicrobium weinanense]MBU3123739.1 hypothetical protein [Sinomicrobium weinanense]
MKKLKVILSTLAFASAITLAFAFSTTNNAEKAPLILAFGEFSTGCMLGTLLDTNCSPEHTGPACRVRKEVSPGVFEERDAYNEKVNGICVNLLRRPIEQ